MTAATLLWFARERCDIVCLEVDLGGRLDSTTMRWKTRWWPVSCSASEGPHRTAGRHLCGHCREKCGILKNNCTVISYPAQPQGRPWMRSRCGRKSALPSVAPPDLQDLLISVKPRLSRTGSTTAGTDLVVPFPGVHQAYNAAVVVEGCVGAIAKKREKLTFRTRRFWAGLRARVFRRVSKYCPAGLWWCWTAHNPDGARALAATLRGRAWG